MMHVMKSTTGKLVYGLILGCSLFLALYPSVRTHARQLLNKDARVVLSSVQADLGGDGAIFTIVKVRLQDKLLLEIYSSPDSGELKLMDRIQLNDRHDGFVNFSDHATNLAVSEVNGQRAILAPSFDDDLVGHLNVFHFDPETRNFNRVLR